MGEPDRQHPDADRPEEQRRPAGPGGRRVEDAVLQPVELAGEVDASVAEQRPDDRERLLEAGDAAVEREPEGAVLALVPAGAEPEDQPSARDRVDRRRLLGEHRRGVEASRTRPAARARPARSPRRGRRATSTPPTDPGCRHWGGRTAGGRRAIANRTRPPPPPAPWRAVRATRRRRSTSGSWMPIRHGRVIVTRARRRPAGRRRAGSAGVPRTGANPASIAFVTSRSTSAHDRSKAAATAASSLAGLTALINRLSVLTPTENPARRNGPSGCSAMLGTAPTWT